MKFCILLWLWGFLAASNGNYLHPDKEYAIVKVDEIHYRYFDNVDCTALDDSQFQTGLYYEGTPCENVSFFHFYFYQITFFVSPFVQANVKDRMCVCFRWTELKGKKSERHYSKMCGMCRDPNALILA